MKKEWETRRQTLGHPNTWRVKKKRNRGGTRQHGQLCTAVPTAAAAAAERPATAGRPTAKHQSGVPIPRQPRPPPQGVGRVPRASR